MVHCLLNSWIASRSRVGAIGLGRTVSVVSRKRAGYMGNSLRNLERPGKKPKNKAREREERPVRIRAATL